MQPHWAAIPAISGNAGLVNGPAIPMERLLPSAIDSNGVFLSAIASGYVRQAPAVHPSAFQSTPNPYNPHQPLGFTFHPSFSVSAQQSLEPGRQFVNATLNSPYQIQQLHQPGPGTQPLSISHTHVPYGHTLPYLPSSLVSAIGTGALGHIPHCVNVPNQSQQVALAAAMAAATQHHTFDSLKHFGALPHSQHARRKPTITSKTNLYISGLHETDTDETVRSLVEDVIQPKSCKAMIVNGNCKGIGFVRFATAEEAEKAVEQVNEQKRTLKGSDKPLNCKLADKADPRRRIAVANAQAAAVRAEALAVASSLQQPIITPGNNLPRTTPVVPNPSVQTLTQPAYANQIPLSASQLIQPFQSASIALSGVQAPVNPRNILVPTTILTNGTNFSQTLVPVSFSSVCPSNVNGQNMNAVTTYRNFSVSNQVPITGVQDNGFCVYTAAIPSHDSPGRRKSYDAINNQLPQTHGQLVLKSLSPENSIAPSLIQQSSLISNINVPNGSQMLILAPAPLNCVYPSPSAITPPVATINFSKRESDLLQSFVAEQTSDIIPVASDSINFMNNELQDLSLNRDCQPGSDAIVINDSSVLIDSLNKTCLANTTIIQSVNSIVSTTTLLESDKHNVDATNLLNKICVSQSADLNSCVLGSVSDSDHSLSPISNKKSELVVANDNNLSTITTNAAKTDKHSIRSDIKEIINTKSGTDEFSKSRLNKKLNNCELPSSTNPHGFLQNDICADHPLVSKTVSVKSTESYCCNSILDQSNKDSLPGELVTAKNGSQTPASCSVLNQLSS